MNDQPNNMMLTESPASSFGLHAASFAPRLPISIRPATAADLSFIDSLQKQQVNNVGWMPTKQLESKIAAGNVLVAEAKFKDEQCKDEGGAMRDDQCVATQEGATAVSSFIPQPSSSPLGYVIGQDQYFKRDDVGIIYQINIAPGKHRALIGAALLKAQFERSAYGCRLYCCWCAQDIEANHFWEAMGFVPLAFRAGSEKKSRVHIFWQKRILAGDNETPWWFPSKTAGGSIREDRIVLPIPNGAHWSDPMPIILPECTDEPKQLADPKPAAVKKSKAIEQPPIVRRNGLIYRVPLPGETVPNAKPEKQSEPKPQRPKRKCDRRLVIAARELRDRWLEQMNADPSALVGHCKHDVTRQLPRSGPLMLDVAA